MFYKIINRSILVLFLINTVVLVSQETDVDVSNNIQYWLDYNVKYNIKEKNSFSSFVGFRSITPHIFNKLVSVSTYNITNEKSLKFIKTKKPLVHSYHLGTGLFYTQNIDSNDNFEFRLVQGLKFFLPFLKITYLNNYIRFEERFQKTINENPWSTGLRIRYKIATAFEWKKNHSDFKKGLYLPMSIELFFSVKESDRFNDKIRVSTGIGYKFESGWKTEFHISYHNTKNTDLTENTTNDYVFRLRVYRSSITRKNTLIDKEQELKELIEVE